MNLFLVCFAGTIAAGAGETSSWIAHLGSTALVVLLPFIAIAGTSFVKLALVLSLLRNALGIPGIPPNSVITALSVVLSIFVMAPVGHEIATALESAAPFLQGADDPFGIASARLFYDIVSPPLVDFLKSNTPPQEISYYLGLAGTPGLSEPSLPVLLSAFATAEIIEGFLVAFLLYVPCVVIDLIVANTILSLGLHMLPPLAISTPLKLLLFIAIDGWHILLTGLLINYSP